jgi:hypothetical protein
MLDTDGTLIFRPGRDQHGVATLRVTVRDNGGTAYGGQVRLLFAVTSS